MTARPYWQTAPCPPWCAETHTDTDHPDMRDHRSPYYLTSLTQEAPVEYAPPRWGPPELHVNLCQGDREVEAVVKVLYRDDLELTLTLEEAEHLFGDLAELVSLGRGKST